MTVYHSQTQHRMININLRIYFDLQSICGHTSQWKHKPRLPCADPGGPDTPPPPLKNHKNIGFLNNTAPDPLKSQSYQASIQCWTIIGTPEERHLNGVSLGANVGPFIMVFWSSLPSSTKKSCKIWTPPPLTKHSGSAHGFSRKMEGFDTTISYTYCSCKCKWVWPTDAALTPWRICLRMGLRMLFGANSQWSQDICNCS